MIFAETKLKGAYLIEIQKLEDDRGFFARSYCFREFEAHGLNPRVVQCNISYNAKKGTLRGMHLQVKPHEEAKLVRCTMGSIYDVIVDLRPNSPTYCQWFGVELSSASSQFAVGSSLLTADSSLLTRSSSPLTAHGSVVAADRSPLTAHYTMLYVPEGFAHGFITLEDDTEVFYQMSEFYAPDSGRGFRWNDPAFGFEWPMEPIVISQRDNTYPDYEVSSKL
jgi:dTDP-4-dehydrorhamnose 3,5-epimerase